VRRIAVAALLAIVSQACLAQDNLPLPAGGDRAMACGQNANGRAYWTEYGFCKIAVRGPGKAKGLVFWSHGVDGTNEQFRGVPPLIMLRLAENGWDVVKINRNNLYERCGSQSVGSMSSCREGGLKHVADLVERARRARAQGYDKIIAAGQSFGGAISLEAAARAPDLFYGVVALSPTQSSDVGDGRFSSGAYASLDRQLLDVLARIHSRLVIALPPADALSPNRYNDPIGPKVRPVLSADGIPFIQFDETLPINGHAAGTTEQFNAWFGVCIRDFLDPAKSPPNGETKCRSPSPVPRFLRPVNMTIPAPGTAGADRWLGVWQGAFNEDQRDFAIIVEKVEGDTAVVVYSVGAGPGHDHSMGWNRYSKARLDGNKISINRGGDRTMELTLSADGQHVDVIHRAPDAKLSATLTRAPRGFL
jgi:pimeloyl-ACP methyl ester carboxylesterase